MTTETGPNASVVESGINLPSSADFMLLGKCNLQCPFCFGPNHELPAMQTSKVIDIIGKLAANGTQGIVFSGGEPTLIKDLPIIINEAKSRGLTTVLSTNGILLAADNRFLEAVVQNLDWISLPLDGETDGSECADEDRLYTRCRNW